MSAIDRLRKKFFPGGSPLSPEEVLRDAVMELRDHLDDLSVWTDKRLTFLEKAQAKNPRKYKPRKPREDQGADPKPDAPARAEPQGHLPPEGSPVPSSHSGTEDVQEVDLETGHNMAVALKRDLLKDHAAAQGGHYGIEGPPTGHEKRPARPKAARMMD